MSSWARSTSSAAAAIAGDGDTAGASDLIGRLADKSLLVHVRTRLGQSVADARHRPRLRPRTTRGQRRGGRRAGPPSFVGHGDGAPTGAVARRLGWQERFDAVAGDLRSALRTPRSLSTGHRRLRSGPFARPPDLRPPFSRRGEPSLRGRRCPCARCGFGGRSLCALPPTRPTPRCGERRPSICCRRHSPGPRRQAITGSPPSCRPTQPHSPGAARLSSPPHSAAKRSSALIDQAKDLAPAGDLEVATHIALASAWDGARGPTVPTDAQGA